MYKLHTEFAKLFITDAANCSALLSQPSIGETTSVDMKCFTSLSYIIFVPVANMSQYELCM